MDKCRSGRHPAAAILAFALLATAGGASAQVVISQVYGGGGNSGAPYTHDFIELHNNGTTAVDLAGWSVQYASSGGTSWARTPLSGSIAPGGYFLVQQAKGTNPGTALPTPDVVGTLALSATAGKVALVNHTSALAGACPTGNVDFVGFGKDTNCAEGSAPTGNLSATVAALRGGNGCSDTQINAADFAIAAPTPRNSASPVAGCAGGGLPVLTIDNVAYEEGLGTALLTASLSQPAGPGGVGFDYATADGTATAGEDYTALVSHIVIPEGRSEVTVTIAVANDAIAEEDEDFHVDFSQVTGAVLGNGRATVTLFDDDYSLTPIHAIQGNGATSPLVGRTVHARGIVTGRKTTGFFLQTPDGETDGDPATSEGVFVYTRSAPPASAAVGNTVIAHGQVLEYIPSGADPGQTPLTELSATRVSLVSAPPVFWPGLLPAPVMLTPDFPSAGGPLDQLERLEGMRVSMLNATVVAPTQGNKDEKNATGSSNGILHVVARGVERPFREPGISVTDPVPGGANPAIPRWDFSPELLTLNSSGLGGERWDLPYDTVLVNLTGPLDYGFRRYTIVRDPTTLTTIHPGPHSDPRQSVTLAGPTVVGVAAYNLERFFDNVDDPNQKDETVLTAAAFERRLNKASLGIRDYLHTPDIVGLIEVENLSVLQTLAERLNADAVANGQPDPRYTAHLLEGNDVGGIDVGFLVKTSDVGNGVARVQVQSVTQLGKDTRWTEPSGASALLNDRPPLLLDAVVHHGDGSAFPLSVLLVHQRSLIGAESDDAAGERIRAKRQRQAEFLATQIGQLQADPERRLVLLGDFNAFEFNDGLVDAMNVVAGTPSADEATVVPGDGVDLLDPDLVNLAGIMQPSERYSYTFDGNAQSLDHVLVNEQLVVDTSRVVLDHARINADFPEINRSDAQSPSRLSDHDPVLLTFLTRHRADLAVTATATTGEVRVGNPIGFTATVTNQGPEGAQWPGIGFAIDAELPTLSVVPSSAGSWSCDAPQVADGRTTVACTTYQLANGESAQFTVSAAATQALVGKPLMLAVAAQSQSIDRDASNDQASATIQVFAVADLAAYLIGPVPFLRSGTVGHYELLVAQFGPDIAVKPYVVLAGDAPAANVRITPPQGWQCDLADAGDGFEATCSGDVLARGALKDFDIAIRAPARNGDGLLTVTARVGATVRDPRADNDSTRHRVRLIGRPH